MAGRLSTELSAVGLSTGCGIPAPLVAIFDYFVERFEEMTAGNLGRVLSLAASPVRTRAFLDPAGGFRTNLEADWAGYGTGATTPLLGGVQLLRPTPLLGEVQHDRDHTSTRRTGATVSFEFASRWGHGSRRRAFN